MAHGNRKSDATAPDAKERRRQHANENLDEALEGAVAASDPVSPLVPAMEPE